MYNQVPLLSEELVTRLRVEVCVQPFVEIRFSSSPFLEIFATQVLFLGCKISRFGEIVLKNLLCRTSRRLLLGFTPFR